MRHLLHWGIAILIALAGSATAGAQANPLPPKPYGQVETLSIYGKLLKQINRIPIYDNHSHATFPDDSDMDAMASPPDEARCCAYATAIRNLSLQPKRSSATPTTISSPSTRSGSSTRKRQRKPRAARRTGTRSSTK